jgi:prefoldin subunit 5
MVDTTDIEKKSLEAHVELCAERYRFLEEKLETVETKVTSIERSIGEIHDMIQRMNDKRNNQILTWGGSAVIMLVSIIGYLLSVYVIK